MTDLVKELRASYDPNDAVPMQVCLDAADRIERLEAALQWYAEHCRKGGDEIEGPFGDYGQRARKALEGKDDAN